MTKVEFLPIPFMDLSRRINRHRSTIDSSIQRVLDSGQFILGKEVKRFELLFAQYIGANHCLCVANGTDAIELALRAVNIEMGMRVATVANAGNYTTSAINSIGAEPIFMEVDFSTRNVTLDEIKKAVSKGVAAVVVTHLYGLAVAEIQAISEYCKSESIPLIEDCAEAHGARVGGKSVGTFGDSAAFSFYPTKNLGALGDAGAVVTNNPVVAGKVEKLRTYGWSEKYSVAIKGGMNSRADEIQAAILADLLPYLDGDNERRREIATMYSTLIKAEDFEVPRFDSEEYVAHHYVVSSPRRAHYVQQLQSVGISTAIHFPISDSNQPYLTSHNKTDLPVTQRLCNEVFSLPCYPELRNDEVNRVIEALI
jgi:dTDP-4-amino-4,6-dideoxygalactose transaminase